MLYYIAYNRLFYIDCRMPKIYSYIALTILSIFTLTSCGPFKYKPVDAREVSPDPDERVKKNIEEGRGFKLSEFGKQQGGVFEFASSNNLWRASLDVIDFMPLTSVNYSGGIIITDWYSENNSQSESIKISIRFMTNEIRSDALNIKVFNKKCTDSLLNCKITEQDGILVKELKREILKKATLYNEEDKNKKK